MPGRLKPLRSLRLRPLAIAICAGLCALLWLWGGRLAHTPPSTFAIAQTPAAPSSEPATTATQEQDATVTPSTPTPKMPPDIQGILDRGELVIGILGDDSPPFFIEDSQQLPCTEADGKFVKQGRDILCGIDIELGLAIAQQLKVDVRVDRSAETFNEVVDKVFNRQVDLAFSKISRTMERVQKVSFSQPYVNMRQGLLLNRLQLTQQAKGRQPAEVLRDLQGEIGVIQDSSYVGFTAQKFPNAEVKEYPEWDDVVKAAQEGQIVAAYRDELEVKKIIRTNPDTALTFQTVALADTNDAIAAVIPWENNHLKELVNQYLETINADYTADQLLETYAYMFE